MATSIALPALVLRDAILRIVPQDEGSEPGTSGGHDGGTGQFVIGPRAVSHALARRSTPMSSKRLPMICTPCRFCSGPRGRWLSRRASAFFSAGLADPAAYSRKERGE